MFVFVAFEERVSRLEATEEAVDVLDSSFRVTRRQEVTEFAVAGVLLALPTTFFSLLQQLG
jgi:hypothetical protein